MLQGLAINHQLAHFANGHLQVLLMSRVGFFFLEGVQVARHPGQAAEQAGLALGGRVRGPCSLGYPPGLAHLQNKGYQNLCWCVSLKGESTKQLSKFAVQLGSQTAMKHCDVLCLLEGLTSRRQMITAVLTPALTKQRFSFALHIIVHKLHTTPSVNSIHSCQMQRSIQALCIG